ncbi:MAG: HyaD/HybD family hydrogenase maturation endopeptidase [Deltaproteobacteria bacterium]|nr:HyaD/HybD family hydrogenase maturation endopeptidase [Deltaproteobacteria bacterium]MBZ0219399.1 HyaD/HybD family hydrogenase maturation endopeptidase [Deltaproteobacteria bacterium]
MADAKRKKALVLGIGNVLLKDEGLGVRAIEYFSERYGFGPDVDCLDGGTSGLGLLSYIKDYSHIIVVDAVAASGPPGKLLRIPGEEVVKWPALKSTSAHQIGLRDLIEIAKFQGLRPELVIIGIIPRDITPGIELTPEAARSVPLAAEAIRDELTRFGFSVEKKG